MRRRLLLPPLLLAVAGCGGAGGPAVTAAAPGTAKAPGTAARTQGSAASPPPVGTSSPPARVTSFPPLAPARCARPDSDACTAHTGTVLGIESVDPDGDGDLHVVATGGSVTAPGITVFDVSARLRPRRDPRPGDRVTGAGPVHRGSYRQRQIEVVEFRVAREGR